MSKYLFETNEAGFYEHGIDLLRNGYIYDQLEYRDVHKAILQRRHSIKNWLLLLCFGISIILLGLYILLPAFHSFLDDRDISAFLFWRGTRAFGIVAVIFLLAFGIYCVVLSFRFSITARLFTCKRMLHINLEQIEKEGRIDSFTSYIMERFPLVCKK